MISNKLPLLVDMDGILADIYMFWFERYAKRTGESYNLRNVHEYDLAKLVENKEVLYKILNTKGFFENLAPMPGAVKYFTKLMAAGYDIVILTQPPRTVNHAIKEKRAWMRKYFPDFGLENMMFAHRKEIVSGCLLLDDNPSHLDPWKKNNPDGISVTIPYNYNKDVVVDLRLEDKRTAWREFYEWVIENIEPSDSSSR